MNKIVASVGLVALGASTLPAAVPGFSEETPTKPWSVAASLRGFFDDNLNTAHRSPNDTWGMEVSPSGTFALATPQTKLSAAYIYTFKMYDHEPAGSSDRFDHTHQFDIALDHAFSPRYSISVADSFAIGQEPDLLRAGNAFSSFQRISGDNIRNYGTISGKAQITPLLGLGLHYNNAFYDYDDEGQSGIIPGERGNPLAPSNSGLLDRLEHTIGLDSLWTISPTSVGVFGYQFKEVDYTGDEVVGELVDQNGGIREVKSEDRNYRQHYIYVGLNQVFTPTLTGSFQIGARYIEYFNDPQGNGDGWGPYAMMNVRWTFLPTSYAELGVTHDINTTDVIGFAPSGSFTSSAETTVVYGSVNHHFTPKLLASVIGQFQNSSFVGGGVNGQSDRYYLFGLNTTYQFTRNFAAEAGYNYDNLDSDISVRSFDRNRVYIGLRASY